MPEKPYIGVTGISTVSEAVNIAQTFHTHLQDHPTHDGMTGYLVSSASLAGHRESTPKYPPIDRLAEMMRLTKEASLNAVHYRTRDRSALLDQLTRLMEKDHLYADGLCEAIQLNMVWPDIVQLERFTGRFPATKLVFQINSRTMERDDRSEIASKLRAYQGLVNYILIDPSGGQGQPFNPNFVPSLFRALRHNLPNQAIILAGGFNDQNIPQRLAEIAEMLRHKEFGIDAEGGLRDNVGEDRHGGDLSLVKADRYVREAARFFSSSR